MAITTNIKLDGTGLDILLTVYVCLQNIRVNQRRDKDGRIFWIGGADVLVFASREAKHDGARALEVSSVECEFDPNKNEAFNALYSALKSVPRFATAVDV